jgi:hypothetical protein
MAVGRLPGRTGITVSVRSGRRHRSAFVWVGRRDFSVFGRGWCYRWLFGPSSGFSALNPVSVHPQFWQVHRTRRMTKGASCRCSSQGGSAGAPASSYTCCSSASSSHRCSSASAMLPAPHRGHVSGRLIPRAYAVGPLSGHGNRTTAGSRAQAQAAAPGGRTGLPWTPAGGGMPESAFRGNRPPLRPRPGVVEATPRGLAS